MAYSTQTATSDGTLALLDISIEYFDRSEITILFDGVVSTSGWAWVGYELVGAKQITFSPVVAAGVVVTVKRTTDLSEIRHDLSEGAAFTDDVMDENFQQVLHIAQEATEGGLGGDFYDDINMHGYKIKNVGAGGTDPLDLVNYAKLTANNTVVQGYATAASNSAIAAAASAVAADASADAAAASAASMDIAVGRTAVSKDSSVGAARIPAGPQADRPSPATEGDFRLNTSTHRFEGYKNGNWGSVGGGATGGGNDEVFWVNGNNVTADFTVTSGTNAGTFGPVTIYNGITVTVESGSVWSVV